MDVMMLVFVTNRSISHHPIQPFLCLFYMSQEMLILWYSTGLQSLNHILLACPHHIGMYKGEDSWILRTGHEVNVYVYGLGLIR